MALTQVSSDGIKNLNVKTADLENSGVTAGTYGSASLIPALVIDAKGRVTSASTNAITQVGGSNGVDFNDNVKALFGTGSDLEIYHDGSNSLIVDNGTGGLILGVAGTGTSGFYKGTGQEPLATFEPDGPVSLYYNNSKKLETDVSGVTITGRLETTSNVKAKQDGIGFRSGASDDLKLYHDGTDSYLQNDTGNLFIRGNGDDIFLKAVNTEDSLICRPNAGVELFYNNSKKFETTSAGVTIHSSDDGTTGVKGDFRFMQAGSNNTIITFDGSTSALKFEDSRKAVFGAGDDLTIKHHGGDSYLDNQTGTLYVLSDAFTVNNAANGENMIKATANGAVELYYDDSKKFETVSWGASLTGTLVASSNIKTASDTGKLMVGAGDDLQIYHDGNNSKISHVGTGGLYIGADTFGLQKGDHSENYISMAANGAVELYYDNSKRIKTLAEGAKVKRHDGGATTLYIEGAEGANAILDMYADDGDDLADKFRLTATTGGTFYMQNYANNGWQSNIAYTGAGNVELYYDGSKKFETTSGGVNITGALTVNGSALTSATNSPAFSAYRSNNYSPSNGSEVVIDFDQERFDTDGCYNFNNGRFTPTTAGNYQINLNFFWSGTTSNKIKSAHGYIRKNGSENIGQFWIDPNDATTENRTGVSVSTIVAMNGSSDYVEAIGYCLVDSGSPRFNAQGATFSGFKLA